MGSKPRLRPDRLAEKLLKIRLSLGLSQNEIISRLDIGGLAGQNRISDYERGAREPSSIILLRYARAANVIVDALIDDELDLPDKLPSPQRHDGTPRTSPARAKAKK